MASITQRLARIAPYLKNGRRALALAGLGAVVGASTEPMIPALLQPLLDKGFTSRELPLWTIPLALIVLFAVRGLAGFVAQYGLAAAAQNGVLQLRQAMFERLLAADPGLYTHSSASQLTNTLVYEVQQGTMQLIGALLTLVKDSLTLIALLGYLLWLNWQLTLFVGLLFPALAFVMRTLGRRLHRLTVSVQGATDELAYVVEENVLAWRIVRLHGAEVSPLWRLAARAHHLRRWELSRSNYPEGKAGYHRWKRDQRARHAADIGTLLAAHGFGEMHLVAGTAGQLLQWRIAAAGGADVGDAFGLERLGHLDAVCHIETALDPFGDRQPGADRRGVRHAGRGRVADRDHERHDQAVDQHRADRRVGRLADARAQHREIVLDQMGAGPERRRRLEHAAHVVRGRDERDPQRQADDADPDDQRQMRDGGDERPVLDHQ